jgi:hypothetical protein
MDPDFQYRTTPNLVPHAASVYSRDDADEGTLRAVYKDLKGQRDGLNKWDAFDLEKTNPLTVEQQIAVNQKVYEILQPSIDAIESALALTDSKFKDRS